MKLFSRLWPRKQPPLSVKLPEASVRLDHGELYGIDDNPWMLGLVDLSAWAASVAAKKTSVMRQQLADRARRDALTDIMFIHGGGWRSAPPLPEKCKCCGSRSFVSFQGNPVCSYCRSQQR